MSDLYSNGWADGYTVGYNDSFADGKALESAVVEVLRAADDWLQTATRSGYDLGECDRDLAEAIFAWRKHKESKHD